MDVIRIIDDRDMKIFVKVKPKARVNKIKKLSETNFEIWVNEPPIDGKANEAVRRILSKYFKKPLSQVIIKTGQASKNKIIEILFFKT
jgi:uncharacterized protein (TIGR00251 family)